jgi:hypothetical protein
MSVLDTTPYFVKQNSEYILINFSSSKKIDDMVYNKPDALIKKKYINKNKYGYLILNPYLNEYFSFDPSDLQHIEQKRLQNLFPYQNSVMKKNKKLNFA